ncbi:MAG: hypothetical protein RMJ98_16005 [Myxococcales bacterium]|nr:OprO/OprP family phosphate-selective porin [Polyangiaceae bacterium]MDW8250801.1 hypothetical protein [Myxococcales bacterium]
MKRSRPLPWLILPLLLSRALFAEPPLMKEHSMEPKIQALSPDGRFAISLGGFLQARYTGALAEEEPHTSHFGAPRTRLYSYGYVHSPDFRYRLMIGTPPYSQQVQFFDAYMEVRIADELRLRGGRFKIPVFREWVESARLLSSIERSPVTLHLLPGRDYGMMASGAFRHETVEYSLGVFNGAGDAATVDSNMIPAVAGRIVWNTTGHAIEGEVDFEHSPPSLALGASGYSTMKPRDSSPSPTGEILHLREHLGGVEAIFRWDGLDIAAEFMLRRRQERELSEDVGGGYLRITQYLPRAQTSIGARGSHLTGNRGSSPVRSELEAEVGYYLEEHDLKCAVDVGAALLGRQRRQERFFQAQVQVSF